MVSNTREPARRRNRCSVRLQYLARARDVDGVAISTERHTRRNGRRPHVTADRVGFVPILEASTPVRFVILGAAGHRAVTMHDQTAGTRRHDRNGSDEVRPIGRYARPPV
jgi:hypothetical protein